MRDVRSALGLTDGTIVVAAGCSSDGALYRLYKMDTTGTILAQCGNKPNSKVGHWMFPGLLNAGSRDTANNQLVLMNRPMTSFRVMPVAIRHPFVVYYDEVNCRLFVCDQSGQGEAFSKT